MITITDKAVDAVKAFLAQEGKEGYGLRLVAQQGCCHLQYGFFLAEAAEEDDTVIEHDGVNFYVDPQSGALLAGAKIDYLEGDQGEGFYIENPNEPPPGEGGCGCGGT